MEYLATVLGTILVMLSCFWLWEHFQKQAREIEALKAEIQKLRDANRKNLPYNTAEEIENLLAAVVLLKTDLEVKNHLVENIEAHAILARENKRSGANVNA